MAQNELETVEDPNICVQIDLLLVSYHKLPFMLQYMLPFLHYLFLYILHMLPHVTTIF